MGREACWAGVMRGVGAEGPEGGPEGLVRSPHRCMVDTGKAQRAGSGIPLQGQRRGAEALEGSERAPAWLRTAPSSVRASDSPPGSEPHSFLIPGAQGPELLHYRPSLPFHPVASLGKAFSRAGASKEDRSGNHLVSESLTISASHLTNSFNIYNLSYN